VLTPKFGTLILERKESADSVLSNMFLVNRPR